MNCPNCHADRDHVLELMTLPPDTQGNRLAFQLLAHCADCKAYARDVLKSLDKALTRHKDRN